MHSHAGMPAVIHKCKMPVIPASLTGMTSDRDKMKIAECAKECSNSHFGENPRSKGILPRKQQKRSHATTQRRNVNRSSLRLCVVA